MGDGLHSAWLATEVPNFATGKKTGNWNFMAGHTYEKKFGRWLVAKYGEEAIKEGPWIKYQMDELERYAQPDFLLLREPEDLLVLECKLTYNKNKAYEQLAQLYYPLVRLLWPEKKIGLIQVCRNLKPSAANAPYINDLESAPCDLTPVYSVFNWRPL